MKKIKTAITLASLSALLVACGSSSTDKAVLDPNKEAVVTVNNNTLYREDLDRVMPINLTGEDSIRVADEYIRVWINELLIYDKAKQNTVNAQTIEELVEEYKKSLITNSYRERILKEHFSKSTSEENLKIFFDQNKDLFRLEEPIIKGLYLKIPASSSQLTNFRKWYTQTSEDAIGNIEKNTLQNAVNYEYFYDRWISLPAVMNNIPRLIKDYDQFLKTNTYLEVEDSTYVYLLNIKEYKLSGIDAPYEFVKEQLPEAYKEKNRTVYLDRIQQDLYNKALSNKEIKFYKEETKTN